MNKLVFGIAASALLLVGCGSDEEAPAEEDVAQDQTEEVVEAPEDVGGDEIEALDEYDQALDSARIHVEVGQQHDNAGANSDEELMEQLREYGYSEDAIRYAVDAVDAPWK